MKAYVATGLANHREANDLEKKLIKMGIDITFSWSSEYVKYKDNPEYHTAESRSEIAEREYLGVSAADILILLCPGGRGTHTEFGIAYSQGKDILVYAPNESDDIPFYYLTGVTIYRNLETLVNNLSYDDTFDECFCNLCMGIPDESED